MLEYVHRIAEKVANEPLEDGVLEDVLEDELENWIVGETEHGHMPLVRKPQGEQKQMKTEEQDNGDLLIILEPEELKKLGWEENDTINIVDNKNGTLTLMKKEEI